MTSETPPTLLDKLRDADAAFDAADTTRKELLVETRVAGYGWNEIAATLNMTIGAAERLATRANNGVRPVPRRPEE